MATRRVAALKKPKNKPRAKKPRRVAADSLTVSVLQATLESTADGILVVDLNGKIVSHNRHFEEMWHLPAALIAANNHAGAELLRLALRRGERPARVPLLRGRVRHRARRAAAQAAQGTHGIRAPYRHAAARNPRGV